MTNPYTLNHTQVANLLVANGHRHTMLVEGETGIGKSAMMGALSQKLPDHKMFYFDCTTKDLGDIYCPSIEMVDGKPVTVMAPNQELGLHHDGPVVVMLDEVGKPGGGRSVQTALNRLMLERSYGEFKLHPESIVFATTNLAAEGLGDQFPAHSRNRVSVVQMRKPTSLEWLSWGIDNAVNAAVLSWVKDTPAVMQSFLDVKGPEDNPYIYHPNSVRAAFCTPRSMAKAAEYIDARAAIGDDVALTAALIGTIGERGAMDLMAYVTLADSLPKRADILKSPDTAKLPEGASAICMVVFNMLMSIEDNEISAWLKYLVRLPAEAQGMFVNSVREAGYRKQASVMSHSAFTAWAIDNRYMFGGDKA